MLNDECSAQVELVNRNHTKADVGNVAVLVSPNRYTGIFDDEYDYDFKLCWIQKDVDPIASIAGDDSVKTCLQTFLRGSASVKADGKVVGKTDSIPDDLQNVHGKKAVIVGLKLVNHDLPKYDNYMLEHNFPPYE